ncbi:sugar O-acetyltransferase [Pseudomonas qingdaonensis]|nr:sugar O-acetyltransferase [Pseudomonas qingdaonensis]
MNLSEKQKMLAGQLYHAGCPELQAEQIANKHWMYRYNHSPNCSTSSVMPCWSSTSPRWGRRGDPPPFHCDYGYNITLGANVFVNFNCVILDVVQVHIGDDCQIGPGVQILTADHPRDPAIRRSGLESGRPVNIGSNVWIGAGALILPGVSIGDDAIIGAGAVVTRDVPAGATAMGNPARVR